ncbi:hypothetical protein BDY19DRAFT_963725 [Irpex rosettiformis]|uniref:Uncharacterized protein n=1 Tax=Irpex rosettiformis TaxID=378272 RepID=A0ACB8TVG2_9APHY|nr:hypothetical protein BDY19DRAFT_963725 [Irpex rosettiformis]
MSAASGSGRRYLSDNEIAALASQMRVADPTNNQGDFKTFFRPHVFLLLKLLGVQGLDFKDPMSDEEALRRLRLAWWDSQRLDYLFPGKTFENNDKLPVAELPSWPGWKNKHTTPRMIGAAKLDHYRDADKLDSWVFRHFQLSAFTQAENMTGAHVNPSPMMDGSWYGVKNAMTSIALDITQEGGKNVPFLAYYTQEPESNMLVMEILDVKQATWPDPSEKEWKLIKSCQETKFGHPANGPLVPMLQTPKMPLIIVRYAYTEGRPKGGLQFMLYLENKMKKSGMNPRKAREELQRHLQSGIEMHETHLRTYARFLSANSDLLSDEYKEELQSHWSGLSPEVIKETNISFIVPCLRLRWRTLEEITLGHKPEKIADCNKCGKAGCKLSCGSCKSVVYCSAECNKADWAEHKGICKFSERLYKSPRDLPEDKFYICTRGVHETIMENGFAIEQEAIKQSGCPKDGECPPNEYGNNRFMIRIQAPPEYAVDEGKYKGQTIFLFDRRRSIFVRNGPDDVLVAKKRSNRSIPFDKEGHIKFMKLVRSKGLAKQLLYLWAKRIGDTLEIDLEDVPENQQQISWN